MRSPAITFSPAMPIPLVFDFEARVAKLKRWLDPNDPGYAGQKQHSNLRAAIKRY
ncbi:MAG: hypothetical protein M1832_005410 [Thelocarpon impressellum]|nr:MAG: hypothetical protein M1832_005410 [Thelocarpon impressellum]